MGNLPRPLVLVTGGAGRLGQPLVTVLAEAGCRVRVFDIPTALANARFSALVDSIAGDLCSQDDVKSALAGVDIVIHLAAVMAPLSEQQPDLAYHVNVVGTQTLLEALPSDLSIIFASSVAVYGVPMAIPVTVNHPLEPLDVYGKTKEKAEDLVRMHSPHWTILRIAPIAVPAVYDLPEPWPFTRDQKVEFIATQDVVTAIRKLVQSSARDGLILNLAGGKSWQVTAEEYSKLVSEALQLDPSWARFQEGPGWGGWYDTRASQELLNYQRTSLSAHITMLKSLYRGLIQ